MEQARKIGLKNRAASHRGNSHCVVARSIERRAFLRRTCIVRCCQSEICSCPGKRRSPVEQQHNCGRHLAEVDGALTHFHCARNFVHLGGCERESTQPCKATDLRGLQLRRGTFTASLRRNGFAPYPPGWGLSLAPFNVFYKKRAARDGPSDGQIYVLRLGVFSDHFKHVGTAPMQDGTHGI